MVSVGGEGMVVQLQRNNYVAINKVLPICERMFHKTKCVCKGTQLYCSSSTSSFFFLFCLFNNNKDE